MGLNTQISRSEMSRVEIAPALWTEQMLEGKLPGKVLSKGEDYLQLKDSVKNSPFIPSRGGKKQTGAAAVALLAEQVIKINARFMSWYLSPRRGNSEFPLIDP